MAKVVAVAYAFGVPYTTWSNQKIAQIAALSVQMSTFPRILTQADVHLVGSGWQPFVEYFPGEKPGEPPPTLRIAR